MAVKAVNNGWQVDVQLGYQGKRSHVLRHTFASHFVMNGGNILTLQKILGHADIKMTLRYAHLAEDHLDDALKYNPLANIDTLSTLRNVG